MGLMNLYPYQQTGSEFLATRPRALLADRMGLGKTAQAITAALRVGHPDVLVVCPASAVPNWEREWTVWTGGQGAPRFLSYSSLIRRHTRPAPVVILDEAHYCKSLGAKRTRAALALAAEADYAWLLTATPMPNDPTELWPMVKYLWPERARALGIQTAHQWMRHFCKVRQTEWGLKPYAAKNGSDLRQLLDGIMLRRTLDDVGLELPPLRVQLHRLPKAKLGSALDKYDASELTEDAYASSLRRMLGEAKAPLVAKQLIEEMDGGLDKVVVLYYHRSVRDILRDAFLKAGHSVAGFGGETPQAQRMQAIDAFQTDPKFRVFLAQQTAAGIAINLTAASEIVLVEPSWSPDDNRQAIARIHRIGQDRPCRARVFAVTDTIDAAVLGAITTKVRMQDVAGLK